MEITADATIPVRLINGKIRSATSLGVLIASHTPENKNRIRPAVLVGMSKKRFPTFSKQLASWLGFGRYHVIEMH